MSLGLPTPRGIGFFMRDGDMGTLFQALLRRNNQVESRDMNDQESNKLTFSFVVPVHDEQAGIEHFHSRLKATADGLGDSYEIIFVDDGSTDETGQVLRRLAATDQAVRVVELSRNFGHQLAITAGYDHAAGEAVVSLDGDCQHPPEVIPELVARWREGFEVVCTVRKDTEGISRIRRAVGRCVYRLIAAVTGADLTDQADFRLLDRKAVDAIKQHRESGRFLRGLVRTIGFRQTTLPYFAEKRSSGKSSYTLGQLSGMAGAGIFNYSLKPLRMVAVAGCVLLAAALGYFVVSLVLWKYGISAGPWAHLAMLIVGLFGLQSLLLAIVGEYVGRNFHQSRQRPLYIIRDKVGFVEPTSTKKTAAEPFDRPQRISVFT